MSENETPERLAWTVRRAAEDAAKKQGTRKKVGLLRLKPFPRIEFDSESKDS